MAEEYEPIPLNQEIMTEPAAVPTDTKKQRAPRRSKEVLAALAAQKAASKSRKSAVKKAPTTGAISGKAVTAGLAKTRLSATSKAAPTDTPAENNDVAFDLIQLEEENKRLRTALAEKLRAENSDLRKRLGHDQ